MARPLSAGPVAASACKQVSMGAKMTSTRTHAGDRATRAVHSDAARVATASTEIEHLHGGWNVTVNKRA